MMVLAGVNLKQWGYIIKLFTVVISQCLTHSVIYSHSVIFLVPKLVGKAWNLPPETQNPDLCAKRSSLKVDSECGKH